jgi:class 3 adenylate cyclase
MSKRILIVDDDEDVVMIVRHHLVSAGYEVLHAFDGLTALAVAVRESPDLIISDVRMPEFDGFGLLAALRANAATRALSILFLTVLNDTESLERAMRLGVDAYLLKPVQRDVLLETVASKLQINQNRISTLVADSADAREAMQADDELLVADFGSQATVRESRHASILYSDIRRFTRIAEILSNSETVDLLRDYYARASAIIMRQRGTVVRYVGDALLAAFDASPEGTPDHAACAVRAALLLTDLSEQFREELNARYPGRGLPRFAIGVGIHTGDVQVCSIGPEHDAEVTLIGDTVNIAARLEGATKRLGWKIVAGESTVEAAGDRFVYGRRSLVVPRGRFASVEVREIKGFAARSEDARAAVVSLKKGAATNPGV